MEYLQKLEELKTLRRNITENKLRRNIAKNVPHLNSENLEEASQGEKVNNVVEVNNAPEAIEDVPNNVDEDEIEIAVDKSFEGEEDINDIQFVKGRPGAQTLGKLVVGQKQQFVCNRRV